MKKLLTLFLMCIALGFAHVTNADGLADKDSKILQQAGIPVYPGLKYVNGSLGGPMGVRFAGTDSVEKVRQWYQKKFPDWAVNKEYGSWILYAGKAGGGPAEYMTKKQIMIVENTKLSEWFGLPPAMKTEVVIVVPDAQ